MLATKMRLAAGKALDPSDVESLFAWFRGDSINQSNGTTIQTWSDKSGNNRHFNQSNTNWRPTFRTSMLNGMPGVEFNGHDNRMHTDSWTNQNQPNTVFVVYYNINVDATPYDGLSDNTGRTSGYFWNEKWYMFAGSDFFFDIGKASGYTGIITSVYNGSNSIIYENGEEKATGNAGTNSCDGFTIGSRWDGEYPLNGGILEYIYCNDALSSKERRGIERYLCKRYGITLQ